MCLDATSPWPSPCTWPWVALQQVPLAQARLRRPRIWAELWASWSTYSTAPSRWTTRWAAANTHVRLYSCTHSIFISALVSDMVCICHSCCQPTFTSSSLHLPHFIFCLRRADQLNSDCYFSCNALSVSSLHLVLLCTLVHSNSHTFCI